MAWFNATAQTTRPSASSTRTSHHTRKLHLQEAAWASLKIFIHPTYRPNLAPSDFHLFMSLSNNLPYQILPNKDVLNQWPKDFLPACSKPYILIASKVSPVIAKSDRLCLWFPLPKKRFEAIKKFGLDGTFLNPLDRSNNSNPWGIMYRTSLLCVVRIILQQCIVMPPS